MCCRGLYNLGILESTFAGKNRPELNMDQTTVVLFNLPFNFSQTDSHIL